MPFVIDRPAVLSVQGFKSGLLSGHMASLPLKVFDWHPAQRSGKLQPGLRVTAYEGVINVVGDMAGHTPVRIGSSSAISASVLSRKEKAGVIYDGYLKIPANVICTFYLSSDDGSKLWLDGEEAVDNDGNHGNEERSGKVLLKKGYHRFRLAYFNSSGNAALKLEYSTGHEGKRPVPGAWFFQDNASNR
jgi:hypothetical protein